MCPNAPYFIILLCLMPDDLMLIKGRVLPLNGLIRPSAHASRYAPYTIRILSLFFCLGRS